MMNRMSKIKKTQVKLVVDDNWYNFILYDEIKHNFPKEHLYLGKTDNVYMVLFQDELYSLSLFEPLESDEFPDFNYIFKPSEDTGILLKTNSLWTKYKISCFIREK